MNKPRLVKREEINQQQAKPVPTAPKPNLTQIKQAVQERTRPATASNANARAAFAALFATA